MSEKKVFPKPVLIISFILILFGCVCTCIQLYHEFFVECNTLRLIMSLLCFVGFIMTILYQLNILKDSRFFYTSLIFIFALTVAISGVVFSEFAETKSSSLDSVVLGVVRRLIQFLSLVVFVAVFVFDARCKDLKSKFFEESTEHLSRILFLEIAIMLIYLCCGVIPAGFNSIWGVFVSPLLFVGVFICYATRIAMKKAEKKEMK